MIANATTSKPARANYRFVNTSDKLAALSLEGARAFHDATLDKFVAYFTNTDYKIVAASANVKHSDKRGDTYEIVLIIARSQSVTSTCAKSAAQRLPKLQSPRTSRQRQRQRQSPTHVVTPAPTITI